MKNITILGAGKSSPYLISWLLDNAKKYNWTVTVADQDLPLAQSRVNNHPNGDAIGFDINNSKMRSKTISNSDKISEPISSLFKGALEQTGTRG